VDAIVNAANSRLQHGGGVAAAIVSRGGRIIQQESNDWVKQHGPATHTHPAITSAGNLPCQHIIHAVGPVWGEGHEIQKLQQAITASLQIANDLKCLSVAFPVISTGIFGFPTKLAAECFQDVFKQYASQFPLSFVQIVKIILFGQKSYDQFIEVFHQ